MSRIVPASLALTFCLLAGPSAAEESTEAPTPVRGPADIRTQNPFFLLFYRLPPGSAQVPAAGHGTITLTSDYSSFFRTDQFDDTRNFAVLDGEIWRNTLDLRVGLGRRLALSVKVPALYGGGGFLDNIIEEYHDTFGFNQEGRDKNPDDQFRFDLVRQTLLAFHLPENDLALGDVSLLLEWQGWTETDSRPAILLRAGIELATGDHRRSFGNGSTDYGLGVAAQKAVGRYHLFGNLGYQILDAPERFVATGVEVRDTWTADFAVERALGRRVSAIAQLGFEQSPIYRVFLPNADDNSFTLTVTISWWVAERWMLDFSFIEDLDGESTQDLTGRLGVGWRF